MPSLANRLFVLGLRASAWTARKPALGPPTARLLGLVGGAWARLRGVAPTASPAEMGARWQQTFPSPHQVPVTRVDDTTAYAEIHVQCPLRGTGDVAACHKLMAYDRAIAAQAGAAFVVLRSQAEPGVTTCQVALRALNLPREDLKPAHEK
jgi:hypothetical protein